MELYILGYLIVSLLYSLFFSYKFSHLNIKTSTIIMLGTTFPLNLIVIFLSYLYRPFGVYISYMVTLNEKK
jgi:hypothetical protein